ncbi:UDP-3-O-[3-hydroxymyristoyl] N-acetylglucosamine deacetylase [Faunimonas pinastri]|uniref:UDP-3-O-acyl-N-acetylglucosamine deacetylase n=1 Tax=Faunimonas pinastri TaxID=1855383 RepID=A0A1H9FQE1_9HYPH|nr:UDP-3-O-acyl-N-acetylglucosamine deacetylase [Faunimonas pinastri]SEQ40107.1 UDP-3-O-[3-hydroxymyristoyl] N-acetylglucosamine deacetylase [Faunimonas pinastri]
MKKNTTPFQKTLKSRIELSGIGVHSGKPVSMTLSPADANTGIVFVRTAEGQADIEIPAIHSAVAATELCTLLGDPAGLFVATVEHLMAALISLGVDNVSIEIDGSEVPVMDGSAAAFVDAVDQVGLVEQKAPKRFIKILKPVQIAVGESFAEFVPFDGFRFDVAIEFANELIGRQEMAIDITPDSFRTEISRARTFGFMSDVERLWKAGYAMGSSLENSVVIGEDRVLNPEGLRYPDEFVRHKLLDAVGDLALAGMPFVGCYRSYKGGHKVNAMALKALLARRDAWTYVTGATASAERDGRASEGRSDVLSGMLAPAFAPDHS